ncbi:MAG: endolytic transglycosylase MltG [Oscillospiraceae bacterium]|nr:endolytic transglycosylase MltG [Oscillospiraceae bacterium]
MIDEQNQVPEPEREEEPPVDGAEQEPQQQPADEAFWAELPLEEPEMVLEERDYHPIRRSRTGKTGILGGVMYAVFVICVSVILACMAWMAARDVLALNKEPMTATVILPDEIFHTEDRLIKDEDGKVTGSRTVRVADIDAVAGALHDAGIIEYKILFKLFASISHADLKIDPGAYNLSTELDYRALVKNMQLGTASMLVTKVTFPEGWTMDQIFRKLEAEEICSVEDLYAAAANFNYNFRFLENAETGDAQRLEGFIFPNTYDFYHGEQAASVINKFLTALHSRITADMWAQIENRGTTFREVVTVASIIEKEAANDEERAKVASVIYNRLASNMTLGMDSTILYLFQDYSGGVQLPDDILNYDSPYNTRLHHGLPPTPICNPGMASIQAALNPESTNYYYYALDTETGTHRFFHDSSEFNAFVATQQYD